MPVPLVFDSVAVYIGARGRQDESDFSTDHLVAQLRGLCNISIYARFTWNFYHVHGSKAWCTSQRARFPWSSSSAVGLFTSAIVPSLVLVHKYIKYKLFTFHASTRVRICRPGHHRKAVRPQWPGNSPRFVLLHEETAGRNILPMDIVDFRYLLYRRWDSEQ